MLNAILIRYMQDADARAKTYPSDLQLAALLNRRRLLTIVVRLRSRPWSPYAATRISPAPLTAHDVTIDTDAEDTTNPMPARPQHLRVPILRYLLLPPIRKYTTPLAMHNHSDPTAATFNPRRATPSLR